MSEAVGWQTLGELDKLRAFAQDVMQAWPIGDVDGGELQDYAIKHGLISLQDPWAEGIECYRKTPLLTGKS